VALGGGEISWQWDDYFLVAAAMRAAAHEFEAPVRWGGFKKFVVRVNQFTLLQFVFAEPKGERMRKGPSRAEPGARWPGQRPPPR
jgi:hypothetical protein